MCLRASFLTLVVTVFSCTPSSMLAASDPIARPAEPQKAKVDLSYVDSSFAAGVFVRPSQAVRSEFGRALIGNAFEGTEYQDLKSEFSKRFGVELENVNQFAVLMSEKSIAVEAGVALPTDGNVRNAVDTAAQKNQLKQIALAFHNYHDANRSFPSANGKLSWRVHLLPYLEQQALYEKFALDEAWDSETNKALIDQMPEIYRTPGAGNAGETSMHVFAGKGGPFENDLGIQNIIDGTSLTIMAAIAGSDTASEWTKPGGLDVNIRTPWEAFGDVDGSVLVALMDGSVAELSTDLEDEILAAALTHAGRELFDRNKFYGVRSGPDVNALPTIIAHCSSDIDQQKAVATLGRGLGEPTRKKGNGKEYWDVGGYAVWFPDKQSMVATQTQLIPRLMSNRQTDSKLRRLAMKHGGADILFVVDTEAMPTMFKQIASQAPIPSLGAVADGWVSADVSSSAGSLVSINLGMSNPNSAKGMQAMLGASLAVGQQSMTQSAPPGMESIAAKLSGLMKGRQIERDNSALSYTIPKPDNYSAEVQEMQPEFKKLGSSIRSARTAAARVVQKNALKQLGLAFHNHHDVYNTFGAADGSTANRKGGLSWRVHLLPFIEQGDLYQRFKLDEPWDSEHNKKLIAEMPALYKTGGTEGAGKTAFHVFVDNGAMFGDGKTPIRFRDILDGTSNTILALEAGSNTAEVWTKPGGLKFDPNAPLAALGNIGDTMNVLFGDGSVRVMRKDTDEDTFAAYITKAGREVVP